METRTFEFSVEMPSDCIQIKQYRGRRFQFLFYSPSQKRLYQIPYPRIKQLNENMDKYLTPRTIDGKQCRMTIESVEQQLDDIKVNAE